MALKIGSGTRPRQQAWQVALRCQGDHRGGKLFHKVSEDQMARDPRGAFLGDHNLVYVLLGLHRDALTRWMRELGCRAWITNSLRVGIEELKTKSGICHILGSDGQVRRQRTS